MDKSPYHVNGNQSTQLQEYGSPSRYKPEFKPPLKYFINNKRFATNGVIAIKNVYKSDYFHRVLPEEFVYFSVIAV